MGASVILAAVPAVYWGVLSASTPGETLWTQTYIVLQHTIIINQCTTCEYMENHTFSVSSLQTSVHTLIGTLLFLIQLHGIGLLTIGFKPRNALSLDLLMHLLIVLCICVVVTV